MASPYLEIPLNRDYAFSVNVASRLTELGNNLTGSTLYFLAKGEPDDDEDTDTVFNVTPTSNNVTNVVTVTLNRTVTDLGTTYPKFHWEISCLTANNLFYTLDQGLGCVTQPVKNSL